MDPAVRVEGEYLKSGMVPGRHVRLTRDAARVVVGRRDEPCAPQVELVRDGEVIQAIDVVCSCGQKIRLHCLY